MEDTLQPLIGLQSKRPEDVIAYLTKLLDAKLSESTGRITSGQQGWLALLRGLLEFMFFSLPDAAPWSAYQQKIETVEKVTEVIERIAARVDGLFVEAGHVAHQLLTRFWDLYCVFEAWDKVEGSHDGRCSPRSLKDRVNGAMIVIFHALGDSPSMVDAKPPMWEVLRMFLVEALDIIDGALHICAFHNHI
jgi:hypothetical protein